MGTISLALSLLLQDVLFVPNLTVNLISVFRLASNTNCFMVFSCDICVLQDRTTRSLIRMGKKLRWLFVFQPLSMITVATVNNNGSFELWYRYMGYPSSQPLTHLPDISVLPPSSKQLFDVYCRAKHSRSPFPNSSSHVDLFALISVDIWGPYRFSIISGAKYFFNYCR